MKTRADEHNSVNLNFITSTSDLISILETRSTVKSIFLFWPTGLDNLQASQLPALNQLAQLKIERTTENIARTVIAFLKKASSIRTLSLRTCQNLDGFNYQDLPSLKKLKNLIIQYSKTKGTGLVSLIQRAPHLEKLAIIDCDSINDFDYAGLPVLKRLKELDLSGSSFSSAAIVAFLKHAPNVKKLILRKCPNFSFAELPELNKLTELDIKDSDICEHSLLTALRNRAPNLKIAQELPHMQHPLVFRCLPGEAENAVLTAQREAAAQEAADTYPARKMLRM